MRPPSAPSTPERRSCTHTFNVMSLFHQHRPAVMGAVLERDVYCEAICDGRHLHPGTVRMLLKCKGWDKVVAITDSMQAAGLPDGDYMLGVNPVTVTDGDAKIAGTGIRAGSTLTLAQAVKNMPPSPARAWNACCPCSPQTPPSSSARTTAAATSPSARTRT